MEARFGRLAVAGMVAAAALCAGTAQAALQDRDLDKNGVTDAFYDTDLDITWLRDANVNGAMTWDAAVAWAANYSFGGYTDWRLPTTLQPDPGCGFHSSGDSYGYNCTGSEMGHLWYIELGNLAGGPMTNTGSFQNLQADYYWSSTEHARLPDYAWLFIAYHGYQGAGPEYNGFFALAVRPGDVTPVPEPQTYALLMLGLTGLAVARRLRS